MRRLLLLSCLLASLCASAQTWPGQAGNAVGYTAWSGWTGSFNATPCPASPASGTSWANATVVQNCTYSTTSHTSVSCNFCEFILVDFKSTATADNNVLVSGSNVLFLADRFQSNYLTGANVSAAGLTQYYFYDSFVPLVSLQSSAPGTLWPSAGAGANSRTMTGGVNATPANSGYGVSFFVNNNKGPFWIDHCDMWGYGDAVELETTTAPITITNNWIHDPRDETTGDHTDGIGYLNGNLGPENVSIIGNTVALLGNTQALAMQGTCLTAVCHTDGILTFVSGSTYNLTDPTSGLNTSGITAGVNVFFASCNVSNYNTINWTVASATGSGTSAVVTLTATSAPGSTTTTSASCEAGYAYNNMVINGNFFSGDGVVAALAQVAGVWTMPNSSFYGNTLGTDVTPGGPTFGPQFTVNASDLWACNLISFRAGTTWTDLNDNWTPTSGMNGQYFIIPTGSLPNISYNSATDQAGNTVCAKPNPGSLNFGGQPVSTSSNIKTVTISCTNTANCTSVAISLTTGTQFSQTNNCSSTITAGSSCNVNLTFTPTGNGPLTDKVVIASNSTAPTNSMNVPLAGIGGLASSTLVPSSVMRGFAQISGSAVMK